MSGDQWYEPMRFEIEVIEVKSDCRVDHRVGETFRAEYRTPDGPVCSEAFVGMYSILYALRLGGDMRHLGKQNPLETTYMCPSRVVRFQIRGILQCNNCGKDVDGYEVLTRVVDPFPKLLCSECFMKFEKSHS